MDHPEIQHAMVRDRQNTNNRVPLMPPQATLKAFVLHFLIALISLLVFSYVTYLFCLWLQPIELKFWNRQYWAFRSDPIVRTRFQEIIFRNLVDVTIQRILLFSLLIVLSTWIGWSRRRMFFVRIRHFILPCFIILAGLVLLIPPSLWLMKLDRSTPLSFAAKKGFKERARLLLWLGADPYCEGFSPFYCALGWRHFDIALMFVDLSPPPQPKTTKLLMLAAQTTNNAFFERDGMTMYIPELPEFKQLIKRLMEAGADPNGIPKGESRRPLQIAANTSKAEAVRILLECGAIIDASGPNGRTALHEAAAVCNNDTIRVLLESGANPNPKENQGFTPLDLALDAGKRHPEIYDITDTVRLLQSHGAVTSSATPSHSR